MKCNIIWRGFKIVDIPASYFFLKDYETEKKSVYSIISVNFVIEGKNELILVWATGLGLGSIFPNSGIGIEIDFLEIWDRDLFFRILRLGSGSIFRILELGSIFRILRLGLIFENYGIGTGINFSKLVINNHFGFQMISRFFQFKTFFIRIFFGIEILRTFWDCVEFGWNFGIGIGPHFFWTSFLFEP